MCWGMISLVIQTTHLGLCLLAVEDWCICLGQELLELETACGLDYPIRLQNAQRIQALTNRKTTSKIQDNSQSSYKNTQPEVRLSNGKIFKGVVEYKNGDYAIVNVEGPRIPILKEIIVEINGNEPVFTGKLIHSSVNTSEAVSWLLKNRQV